MSLLLHSLEIGIKLSEDMEIAIQAESLCIKLFRSMEISDCYVNIKSGKFEMTFGDLEIEKKSADEDAVLEKDTPLLLAASRESDQRCFEVSFESKLTAGPSHRKTLPASSKIQVTQSAVMDDTEARDGYNDILEFFKHTDAVSDARRHIRQTKVDTENTEQSFDVSDTSAIRAAICSELHSHPSISHPPPKSIKTSVIKSFIPKRVQTLIHRLPLLLRLILGPFSYFHPIKIRSITTTTSGRFLDSLLVSEVFQSYEETDNEIRLLKDRVSAWLSEANFAIELASITGAVQVPFLSQHDMTFSLNSEDVMAYRSLPGPVHLNQVARLGGADARFEIPIFLLPHHEHLLPPLPTARDKEMLSRNAGQADGRPKEVQAIQSLDEASKDEANFKISFHARLPAVFDHELLNFIVALLKASKIIEMEREGEASAIYDETHGLKELSQNWRDVKRSFKRSLVDGVVNEKWIAKLVGKITTRLELAQGEAGYSGTLPIKLENFRTGLLESEGEKLLP
ncbi:hypothetical protein K3495_g2751 [Podosphaera aphanis]|nr:hypothetical protein K3495_g2751 [Podosphaera aphanis]